MANAVGTATNFEDLFTKMVDFITTNATLVSLGQQWTVMRQRRDNLASITTNIAYGGGVSILQTMRSDARSLNVDQSYPQFYTNNLAAGTAQIKMVLRTTSAVGKVAITAPNASSGQLPWMLKNFRLQYSDDGTNWTTCLTVASNPTYTAQERKEFTIGSATGNHLYWQIIIDSANTGTQYCSWSSILLIDSNDVIVNHYGSEVIFRAPGTSGTDQIFTGIRSAYDASAGWYNLFLNGYTGYNANYEWFDQPGALPGFGQTDTQATPMVPCWDSGMPYWFSASGRVFKFAVKVGTIYEGGYLGFILPYSSPSKYPYPLAIGGSLSPATGNRTTSWLYSYVGYAHGVYCSPGGKSLPSSATWATLLIRDTAGVWQSFSNRPDVTDASESVYAGTSDVNDTMSGSLRFVWPGGVMQTHKSYATLPYRECLGGGYMLQPCIPVQRSPGKLVYGELDGVYIISGFNNAAENTFTKNSKTHVVFQNTYRSTVQEFWAMTLE